ncbi:MAG: glycerol-3-phosphate dehydrogenase [Spirochaetes bacterium]|uniref:Glycerol-3-phosphate dehydrogenase n=1 Tax=Candidatus Ornithospirochaeta stercoripullorum TaxID=2840899 RepID=A0A9D9E4W8_9SPIO|nr:glycerol-3-phosphate dehydrogenase [Candidatus Ornithospirochaeta stercoripullorum]
MNNIVIAGAGTFGTAVAERLTWNINNRVTLHTIEKDVEKEINDKHTNRKYFPTRFLNRYLTATSDFSVFKEADVIMLVIPSQVIVPFSEEIRKNTAKEPLIINLAKGMSDDGAFITEKIPFSRTASMKGPSFAIETINGFPTSFTFGGRKEDYDYFRKEVLPDTQFSLDWSKDVRAVELMSILKNMYAIAIGIVSGKFNSPNVDFLVYTKAVNEMRGLLRIFECDEETIFRYCGIGDLGLTALNDLSRNRTLGMLIGKGFGYDSNSKSSTVVEGLRTIKLIGEITRQKGVSDDFPLVQALYKLLYENDTLNNYTLSVLG